MKVEITNTINYQFTNTQKIHVYLHTSNRLFVAYCVRGDSQQNWEVNTFNTTLQAVFTAEDTSKIEASLQALSNKFTSVTQLTAEIRNVFSAYVS